MQTKNIVVGALSLAVVLLMGYTAMQGGAYQGGSNVKVISDIGSNNKVQQHIPEPQTQEPQAQDNKEDKELQALKDKAGNIGKIKISAAYRSKCAACHGVDGSGMQDGKKLIGPKLFGQDSATIYEKLADFKAGRKDNVVMKGLLINTSEEELKAFADEIGGFATQTKE